MKRNFHKSIPFAIKEIISSDIQVLTEHVVEILPPKNIGTDIY